MAPSHLPAFYTSSTVVVLPFPRPPAAWAPPLFTPIICVLTVPLVQSRLLATRQGTGDHGRSEAGPALDDPHDQPAPSSDPAYAESDSAGPPPPAPSAIKVVRPPAPGAAAAAQQAGATMQGEAQPQLPPEQLPPAPAASLAPVLSPPLQPTCLPALPSLHAPDDEGGTEGDWATRPGLALSL